MKNYAPSRKWIVVLPAIWLIVESAIQFVLTNRHLQRLSIDVWVIGVAVLIGIMVAAVTIPPRGKA